MNEIRIYDFPERELDAENNWMRSLLPFAVVGSDTTLTDEDGTKYRGREYPWGTVNIENQVRSLDYRNITISCSRAIVTFPH